MYPIIRTETLIETKTCRHCQASFPITDKDLEFYEKISPVFPKNSPLTPFDGGGKSEEGTRGEFKKYSIPSPTLCPDCRQQRRLSFRNERKLYKRKCDATGRDIISIYSPDKPFKVYHQDFWWSDKWDPMDYGRDFDFERGFFEQFGELMREVPMVSNGVYFSENSEYCNYIINCKDSYLIFSGIQDENCMYGRNIRRCTDCVDSLQLVNSENCFECTIGANNYNVSYSYHVFGCNDSSFLWYCEGCNHCYGCTNLKNKEYYFFNEQLIKEDYENKIKNISIKDSLKRFDELIKNSIHVSINMLNNEGICSDDFIRNSSNVLNSYNISNSKNLKYCTELENSLDCMDSDIGIGIGNTLCYESQAISKNNTKALFSFTIGDTNNLIYCFNCVDSSSNLFGCIGLRNKSYCILNKQYTKEEYEELVPKIIEHMRKTGEWGEFFPSSLSPFGYNETVAQEYFPLNKEEATKNGVFNWSDYEAPFPRVEKIIPAAKLPEDIAKIPDDILNWAIECEVTRKPFRIIKQELEFYRKHNLPIPRRHPDQRHLDRMALRNPRKLFERKCDKCGVEMMTTYAPCDSLEVPLGCSPERPEKVYCESCYNKEVIG